jgi:hypothetical protein
LYDNGGGGHHAELEIFAYTIARSIAALRRRRRASKVVIDLRTSLNR